MLAKKCDICGTLYEAYNCKKNARKPSGIMLVNVCNGDEYYSQDVTDCCPKCMASIMDTIESLRQSCQSDQTAQSAPVAPEPCLDEPIGEW